VQQVAVSKKLAARATYLLTICALVLSVFYPITKAFAVTTTLQSGCIVGSSSSCPGDSAWQIKQATGTSTNGLYWVTLNGSATQVWANMDSTMGGGGWMLAMKGTATGTDFPYSGGSNYWTTNNTLIPSGEATPTNLAGNSADAKYNVYNYATTNQIMAIFPGYTSSGNGGAYTGNNYGFTWADYDTGTVPFGGVNYSYTGTYSGAPNVNLQSYNGGTGANCPSTTKTLLYLLGGTPVRCLIRQVGSTWDANESPYSAIGNGIFSSQTQIHFFGFNYTNTYNSANNVRWGLAWNENETYNESSNDVRGGIGGGWAQAGDQNSCCSTQGGKNTQMAFELYGRDTSIALSNASTSFTSRSGQAGGATFAVDTSTISAESITVSDVTNSGRILSITDNGNGTFSITGALANDQISIALTYYAKSGYKGTGTINTTINATSGATGTSISIGAVNKLNTTTITVTVSPSTAYGTVNFYWNNRIINRCSSRTVSTGTATCTWKPMTQGQGFLTASFSPSDGVYQASSATPKYVVVGKRTGSR
jgi:Bacterial Ig-like domain (group 3)